MVSKLKKKMERDLEKEIYFAEEGQETNESQDNYEVEYFPFPTEFDYIDRVQVLRGRLEMGSKELCLRDIVEDNKTQEVVFLLKDRGFEVEKVSVGRQRLGYHFIRDLFDYLSTKSEKLKCLEFWVSRWSGKDFIKSTLKLISKSSNLVDLSVFFENSNDLFLIEFLQLLCEIHINKVCISFALITPLGLEILGNLLSSQNCPREIELQRCTMSPNIGANLMKFIEEGKCLVRFKISDLNLKEFTISGNRSLQSLTTERCNLSDFSVLEIGRLDQLNYLDLSWNILENCFSSFLEIISNSNTLKSLRLCSTHLLSKEGFLIAKYLRTNSTLTELDISHNTMKEATMAIIESLIVNNSLKKLNICNIGVGEEEVKKLAKVLAHDKCLTELNIQITSSNNLIPVFQGLKSNKTLKSLFCDIQTPSNGQEEIFHLCEMLSSNSFSLTCTSLLGILIHRLTSPCSNVSNKTRA